MLKYIIKRFVYLVPVIFLISIIMFGLLKAMPGDPARFMVDCPPEQPAHLCEQAREDYRERYRLNDPIPVQYIFWLGGMFRGDLGESSRFNQPVSEVVGPFILNSVYLNVFTIIMAFLIAIPIGIISAVRQYSLFDNFWQIFSLLGISMPSFFFGILLIYLFAMTLKWLPLSGMVTAGRYYDTWFEQAADIFKHMLMPATVLIVGSLAGTIRYVRTSMLEVIRQDYIRTARSKGLSEKVVIYSHAFRNALIPVVTLLAFSIPGIFSGATIIERIFNWPGIGNVLLSSLIERDYSVVLAMNMFYAFLALFANLVMDLSYALVDPRVRLN